MIANNKIKLSIKMSAVVMLISSFFLNAAVFKTASEAQMQLVGVHTRVFGVDNFFLDSRPDFKTWYSLTDSLENFIKQNGKTEGEVTKVLAQVRKANIDFITILQGIWLKYMSKKTINKSTGTAVVMLPVQDLKAATTDMKKTAPVQKVLNSIIGEGGTAQTILKVFGKESTLEKLKNNKSTSQSVKDAILVLENWALFLHTTITKVNKDFAKIKSQ